MATKIILASVAASVLLSSTTFAQVQHQGEDNFAPRTYGSTAVTPVDYRYYTPTNQSTTVNRVVEPVTPNFQGTILTAPTYTPSDVVRAQHFKRGDIPEAQYQALLEEADRIRAYQTSNTYNTDTYTSDTYTTDVTSYGDTSYGSNGYGVELFEPEVSTASTVTYTEATPVQTFSNSYVTSHHVLKGDTLYNISKRYDVSLDSLKSANNISANNISIGQMLNIPSAATVVSTNTYSNTYSSPVSTTSDSNLTYIRNVEPIIGQSNIYAVLPKDTLYSISRRACVKVADLISRNAISSPSAIQPGQRLTMPDGHCLN